MYLKTKGVDLRRQFVETFLELAKNDKKLVFITCDVGFSFLEPIEKELGDRYLNLGITEPSAMVVAAGLALQGMKPYIYSMINFVTLRVHEQLRNAVCCHGANVKILGVKGSEKYKFLGFSHNLIRDTEEIDFLEKLPNIKCYLPKENIDVETAVKESYKLNKAAYIRL